MAKKKNRKSRGDALDIVWREQYEGHPERIAALEHERLNVAIAQAIYDLRKKAGLTQADLARMVGTQPSAISRLENSDYNGHSLSMLIKVVAVFMGRVSLSIVPATPNRTYLRAPSGQKISKERVLVG